MSKPGQGWTPGQEPPYAWRVQSIIAEICQRAGLPYDRIGPAMVQGICEGYAINGGEEAYSAIEVLAAAYLFDPANYNGRLNFVERGGPVVAVLTRDDLLDDSEGIEQVNRRDPITVPRTLNLNYYDIDGGLTPDKQTSDRSLDNRARGDKSMETTVIMRADDAARLTVITHKVMIEEQRGEVEFKLPDTYAWLTVSDCITLDGVRLRISEVEIDEGFQSYKCQFDRPSAYSSTIQGVPPGVPSDPPSLIVADTRIEFIDSHILADQDDILGYYLAVSPLTADWTGATVEISKDGGATWIASDQTTTPAVMGDLIDPLPAAPVWYRDNVNTLRVRLLRPDMELITATVREQLNRLNLAIVGNELVSFADAVQVGERDWELTGLLRGRKGSTIPAIHAAGTRFVLLDGRQELVPAQLFELGRPLTFRATSFGADVQAAPVTVTYTGQSQVERQPAYLRAVQSGGDLLVTWQGVGRLGGGASVGMGAQFAGYRVTLGASTIDTMSMSATIPYTPGTLSVRQLNRITGPGPEVTVAV